MSRSMLASLPEAVIAGALDEMALDTVISLTALLIGFSLMSSLLFESLIDEFILGALRVLFDRFCVSDVPTAAELRVDMC